MTSNISLEITALIFALFVLSHFLTEKKINDRLNRIFAIFIVLGILDIFTDIVSTVLIEAYPGQHIFLTKLFLTMLYLVQSTMLLAFIEYTRSLCHGNLKSTDGLNRICMLISTAMSAAIIVNWWTGYFFYYDSNHVYHHGSLYVVMYLYAMAYFIIAGTLSIRHRQELSEFEFRSLCEYLLIIVVAVAIQFTTGSLLTIGVGIALGVTILYITTSNPQGQVDNFTGVPDGGYFNRWLQEKHARKNKIYLVAIDLFRLDWLNQAYGVVKADEMLLLIVEKFKEIAGDGHLFRLSTQRFVMEIDDLDEYDRIVSGLITRFETPVEIDGRLVKLPAKLCGVIDADRFTDVTQMIEYVDYMLGMIPDSEETIFLDDNQKYLNGFRRAKRIENYLTEAIEQDLFTVSYQPVYSIAEGRFVSLEALSRLSHPELGPIPPDQFITMAEKSGQIDKISELQVRRICAFLRDNSEVLSAIESVKINLSPQELLKDGKSQMLVRTIQEYGLPLSAFQFEITETVATEYSNVLMRAVKEFGEAGIRLCLDDFGSGFANLNTVLKLPFETIKLDRSLLSGILTDENIAGFYEKIVGILKGMGYSIISEGVEERAEFELLSGWNVDMIQGYYFAKPLPEDELLEVLRRQTGNRGARSCPVSKQVS